MYSVRESFKSVKVDVADPYLDYFLDFYLSEIRVFFPLFNKEEFRNEKNIFALLLLRNASVAGVFMGIKNNHKLTVQLDFVTAEYRDLKPGDFIYKKNIDLLKDFGIEQIECETTNKSHQKYLTKMGFEQQKSEGFYVKNI